MPALEALIQSSLTLSWLLLIAAFVFLFKCADVFVTASVGLAERFNIPRLVIGIVLVSLATTAPELSVSMTAALRGNPEMALGNAIGSVICDDGLALGLAGIVAARTIPLTPGIINSTGIFLIAIQLVTFLFVVFDRTLGRMEGLVLVLLFAGYLLMLFRRHSRGDMSPAALLPEQAHRGSASRLWLLFLCSLAGIIAASHIIILCATSIALSFNISETVIAMTLVAFGTSIPEIATCITAARKGEGALAVGNILGADIMNICWVAGASAMANSLTLSAKDIWFMFPSMFIIVGAMLLLLRAGYCLTRAKGAVLLGLYACYLAAFFVLYSPGQG